MVAMINRLKGAVPLSQDNSPFFKTLLRVSLLILAVLFVAFMGSAIIAGAYRSASARGEGTITLVTMAILALAMSAALIVAWKMKRNKSSESTGQGSRPRRLSPNSLNDASASFSIQISALTDLLLNAKLRCLSPEITGAIEDIIRRLIVVLPKASRYKGTELAWVSSRLAEGYLSDLVNGYAQLSESGRENKKADLMETMGDIQKKLNVVDSALDTGDIVSFDSEVRYLRGMISKPSIEVNQLG